MAMAKKIGVLIRNNKQGNTFYCRLWYPPTKNSRNITLGKETEVFTEVEAIQRLNILKDHFKRKEYDYKLILKKLDEDDRPKVSELTLNQVAEQYFDKKFESIKKDFLNDYKDRFEFTSEDDLASNPVFKKKKKHFQTYRNYYKNHFEVLEWKYKQEITVREKKKKDKLTKVGVVKYRELGLTRIVDVSKQDIETWMNEIQKKLNLAQKTKHNIISQLKTIFNFAVYEEYLEKSVFDKIKKEQFTKNPHNYRERLLDIDEMNELMGALFIRSKKSFYAALLGLATGARVNSVLNMKKSDFHMREKDFLDAYVSVDIINFKTQATYSLPLVENIGRYFYYLLKDYKEYEYVVRASQLHRRTNEPMMDLPKEFRQTTDRTVNASEAVKELYKEIDDNIARVEEYYEKYFDEDYGFANQNAEFYINRWKQRNIDILDTIKIKKKEYLADKKTYLKVNFSFHNFRHQLVSLTSIYNPLYAKRILNHSSDRNSATTDRYIKSDMHKVKEILEKALKQYVIFLEPIIKDISSEFNFEELKKQFEYENFVKPKEDAVKARRDRYDIEEICAEYIMYNSSILAKPLSSMSEQELIEFEDLAVFEYELREEKRERQKENNYYKAILRDINPLADENKKEDKKNSSIEFEEEEEEIPF